MSLFSAVFRTSNGAAMPAQSCEHVVVDVAAANGIRIEQQFADLIPPLADEERAELEASIVQHGGAREPLIVWYRNVRSRPTLIDGHHRYAICTRLDLPYAVRSIDFASEEHAKAWIERNQIGRRNLSRDSFAVLLGRLYNRLKKLPGGRGPKQGRPQRTRERLAAEYGVDPRTVDRAGAFQSAAEKLGIDKDIATGTLRVHYAQVISASKAIPVNATRDEAMAALQAHRKATRQSPKRHREPQSWLVPEEPADCLKAIRFYAKSFIVQSPDSVDALNELLAKLIDENGELRGSSR